jgi:nitrite reductase/ring-hydroxylating ferredoxin subunit
MSIRVSIILFLLALSSCEPQVTDDPIPWLSFPEILINLGLPEFNSLRQDGGIKEINDGGVRGIIVYRVNAYTYHAYERNCSFQPNSAGATVNVHSSKLYLIDDSCGSSFSLEEGTPTGGPAWRPLRQYRTILANNFLTITDEAIN